MNLLSGWWQYVKDKTLACKSEKGNYFSHCEHWTAIIQAPRDASCSIPDTDFATQTCCRCGAVHAWKR